ncbi:MAG: amidophosphoribosyltransferase [Candidatus Woesearchaeota archaeon]|nr:amidophosphoribosyltransferase [Candidatus Woesearchaeota archaeon]
MKNWMSEGESSLVTEVFRERSFIDDLVGDFATGHVRYSTEGGSSEENAQPLKSTNQGIEYIVSHNGNITNYKELRNNLESKGAIFRTSTDTEVILHLIAHSQKQDIQDKVLDALRQIEGAYSVVITAVDHNHKQRMMFVGRDPHGFRPLCIGVLEGKRVFASESYALHLMGAKYDREVNPGELISINQNGHMCDDIEIDFKGIISPCIFEKIYFARPDSVLFGENNDVAYFRRAIGRQLAEESPVEADIVIDVPDSGRFAALGYAEKSGIPYNQGLVRSHYAGRTFIEPSQIMRHDGVKIKLSAVRSVLNGKRVIVVDDSIVRSTTTSLLRDIIIEDGGAKEVHFRISSPSVIHPCYYGMDFPTGTELIASSCGNVNMINRNIRSDSLAYLSLDRLRHCYEPDVRYCEACFSGQYPAPTPK